MRHSIAAPRGADREAGHRLAHRDADLQGDDVEAGHHLGDRVLDLQASVHLQEVEVPVLVDDALDRAGVHVAGLPRERDRCLGEALAHRVVDRGRRRLLDQLLMAPLHRAVALAEEDRRCRGRRPGSAPPRGAPGRRSARGTPRAARSTTAPRAHRASTPPRDARRRARCACPCRRRRTRPSRTSGKPMRSACFLACFASTGSGVPGTIGMPLASAARRAAALSPIVSIASGDGPTNVRPASATASGELRRAPRGSRIPGARGWPSARRAASRIASIDRYDADACAGPMRKA